MPGQDGETDAEVETTIQSRVGLDVPAERIFVLQVLTGNEAGQVFELSASEPAMLIGTGPACGIRVADPMVSRRHVALEMEGTQLRVRDVGSTNGTWVQGVLVADALLGGGELMRLGTTELQVEARNRFARAVPPLVTHFGNLLGSSPQMRRLYPLLERLAGSTIPVVIEGETGTGKEVLAEELHGASTRAGGPFVVFDCTAVPPSLVESELFGHERGAFTGASSSHPGLFQQAHGGTLLIDEIGDLDMSLQPKLLRAIERLEVRPVGGKAPVRVDVRLLAATRRDLDHEVQHGRFRDDLFHRLAVGRVELPPLRRREGDVALLARHFYASLGGQGVLPEALLARWEDEPWPGNVRELRNRVARHIALGDLAQEHSRDPLDPAMSVPSDDAIGRLIDQGLPFSAARRRVIQLFEQRFVQSMLDSHSGSVARAAQASGITERYFHLLKKRSVE